MIKLVDLYNQLQEGVTVDGDTLRINVIKSTDHVDDPFIINRGRDSFKKSGVPIYYGISPNPNSQLDSNTITDLYDNTKDLNKVDQEDLYKLVLLTAPSIPIHHIIALPSSAGLNKKLVEALKQKYKVPDSNVLTNTSKIEYFIDDMINQEKYAAADPITQRMASTWIKSLKKKYGDDAAKMVIKKSRNKETGHPGIQSGARGLLNPVYSIDDKLPTSGKLLVVDDFLIGGSSFAEVFSILIKNGVPKENIVGYCLGTKKVK